MAIERRRILFSGRVQGVGFRATTRRLASGFVVAGFVRNLPDGRVEVVVEGEPAEIARFESAIRAEFGRSIHDAVVSTLPTEDPPWEEFTVRY